MKIGIYLDMRNPPRWARRWQDLYAGTLDLCAQADALGFDAVWLSEHHFFDDGYLPQPLTLAAAIGARTRRVKLGTAVLLAPLRHPVQLAEEAAVVDLISGGRLELGLGVGYRFAEYQAFGAPIGQRFERFEQMIDELRSLWDGVVTPAPLQRPIPLWGGFLGPRGARLAGKLGMGLLVLEPALMKPYHEGLAAGGHDALSARVGGVVQIIVSDDPEAAWRIAAPHVAYGYDSYSRHDVIGTDRPVPPPVDPETLRAPVPAPGNLAPNSAPDEAGRRPFFQVLTPDETIAHVRALTSGLPVEHVFFWASYGGMPDALAERHLELLATRVAPALRNPPPLR